MLHPLLQQALQVLSDTNSMGRQPLPTPRRVEQKPVAVPPPPAAPAQPISSPTPLPAPASPAPSPAQSPAAGLGGGGGQSADFPVVLGPDPYITAAFRGLFTPEQIAQYGHGQDLHYTMGKDGKVVTSAFDWGQHDNGMQDNGGGGGAPVPGGAQNYDAFIPAGVPRKEGLKTRGTNGGYYMFQGGKWVQMPPGGGFG